MNIIKLNAIDSTNNFLKELSATQILDNFTTVVTENQLKGKGQRGATWVSEDGKNLTFSTYIHHNPAFTNELFTFNVMASIALVKVLEKYQLPQLHIKWPNDILSENKKICGILIENTIKSDGRIHCIIGIGLNVNQMVFQNLPKASSMVILKNMVFDKEVLLNEILKSLKHHYNQLENPTLLWKKYHTYLYKKGIPVAFENTSKEQFMGIIQGVSTFGKLMVLLENDTIHEYDIKEIKMLY